MNTIAIDCGASFLKGALFQNDVIIKRAQRQSPVVHGNEGLLEPVQINHLLPMVKDLILDLAFDIDDFRLCISNEMHGFILANQDGSPYTDYISWQKEYGNEMIDGKTSVDILSKEELADDILKTGMPLRGGLPSSNMLYLNRIKLLSESPHFFYTLGDYIIRVLSGIEPVCHPTNAAATGLFDVVNSKWNEQLLDVVSNDNVTYPNVGLTPLEFDLGKHHVICLPALGDQQAALLGAGFDKDWDISFNLGTGAQVSKLTRTIELSDKYQTRPYFNGYFLKSIPHLPSGRALNVFIRFFQDVIGVFGFELTDAEIWSCLLKEVEKCEKSDLSIDLSFFQTPLTNHQVGSIENIREHELTVGKLMKAVISQMVSNFIKIANIIEPDHSEIKRIVFSGGIARRIEPIRKGIISYYGETIPVTVSEDETLIGLNNYAGNES